MKLNLIPVESKMIAGVDYIDSTNTLVVQFKSRPRKNQKPSRVPKPIVYFKGVPRKRFEDLLKAPSKGEYFNDKIRDVYVFRYHSGRRKKQNVVEA